MIVYIAIAAMFAMLGGIILLASFDNPDLERAEIDLAKVNVVSIDEASGNLKIETVFLISNPGDKTFTVSLIDYDVFADDLRIASGQYSTVDIAMPGRTIFYPGAEIELKSFTTIAKEDISLELYDVIAAGEFDSYAVKGVITLGSSWSEIDKEFQASM